MEIEKILLELILMSALVSLTTEAVKEILDVFNKSYNSNILAGIIAVVESFGIGICDCLLSGAPITEYVVIYLIIFTFMSWLGAMVGYDKVIQTIDQIFNKESED